MDLDLCLDYCPSDDCGANILGSVKQDEGEENSPSIAVELKNAA